MTRESLESPHLRLQDVRTFVAVYDCAKDTLPDQRRSTHELLEMVGNPKTIQSRLKRVADFFLPTQPGIDLERLYQDDENGVLQIKEDTEKIAKLLMIYKSFADGLLDQFRGEIRPLKVPPLVRLGCPEIIGYRLLAPALGDWTMALGGVDLHLTIDNSKRLIPRLHAGHLDMVISYGDVDQLQFDKHYQVSFASLGYQSQMCLYCHPGESLSVLGGTNINAGYWEQLSNEEGMGPAGANLNAMPFDKLKPVNLNDINFRNTPLIVVDSWHRPKRIDDFISQWRDKGAKIRIAESYDEAMALVKMRLGVAVATEMFPRREHVTVFRIVPEESYQRWIGVYYQNRFGVSNAACQVAEFLRRYREKFFHQLYFGKTPGYGDQEYKEWWMTLIKDAEWQDCNWESYSRLRFPLAK